MLVRHLPVECSPTLNRPAAGGGHLTTLNKPRRRDISFVGQECTESSRSTGRTLIGNLLPIVVYVGSLFPDQVFNVSFS